MDSKVNFGSIIVETRRIENLKTIIDDHLKFLPVENSNFLIFCNNQNIDLLKDHYHWSRLIPIPSIDSLEDYNNLLTSKRFWNEIPFEKILVFQSDSMLLRIGIEEFFKYDFIGAPLYHMDFPCMNGGLSLRTKSMMIKCLRNIPYNRRQHGNEDIYYSYHALPKLGGKLPDKETAMKFSVETIYGLDSLGYHAIDKWHSEEKCSMIKNQYVGRTK